MAKAELQIEVRQIEPGDKFSGFSIGDQRFIALKIFLKQHAHRFQSQSLARTYGAFTFETPQRLLGYVTLVCGEVALKEHDGRLVDDEAYRYPQYPAVKIARLAVDSKKRGTDIETHLVDLSLGIAKDQICPAVGCRFVMVDSKQDSIGFYTKCGFTLLQTETNMKLDQPVMYVDLLKAAALTAGAQPVEKLSRATLKQGQATPAPSQSRGATMRDFARRCVIPLLCAIGALIVAQSDALAGVRLALVIGNGQYQNVPTLDNPSNDAADVAQALRGAGFEVIEQRDATREAMASAVRDFSERLRNADIALFFYAGHGLQMNGENYLLPVDAKIESPADVRFNTINLSDVQQEMEGSGRANIIILDACRNNPFLEKLSRGGRAAPARGLGVMEATGEGSLIVYSTQPGNVALDGAGRNSPFTAALLKHLATPGLEVRQMISRVRGDVLEATGHRQRPWDNSSLVGDVYLGGPLPLPGQGAAAVSNPPAAPPAPVAKPPAPAPAAEAAIAPREAAPASAAAGGPAAECERRAAPAPPFASPAQMKEAKTRDYTLAIAPCEAAADANPNVPRLQYLLGLSYDVTKNYQMAARHYAKAADAGYADAQDALGVLFATGRGVVKDPQRAFDLLNRSASGGSPGGMNDLGVMYSNGIFVKADPAKALDWFEKAIEAGNSFGLAEAGVMYFNGRGAPRDYNAAAQYFQQAADLGDGYSLKFLAIMYQRGLLGKSDSEKAAALRLQAAQIDPNSQNPDVPPAARAAAPPRASGVRFVRIRRYRFLGCNWLWC